MTLSTMAPIPRGAAELFYLSAHDSEGNPQLTDRALGLSIASAVSGELVISEYLECSDDRALIRERGRTLLRSPLTSGPTIVRLLLERISGAPAVAPRDWITGIAQNAPLWIARRLQAACVVRAVTPSRLRFWDTAPRFVPYDLSGPHKLGAHIRFALQGHGSMTLQGVFLAGLPRMTQLHRTRIGDILRLDELIAEQIHALTTLAHPAHSARGNSLKVLLDHTDDLINTAVPAQPR